MSNTQGVWQDFVGGPSGAGVSQEFYNRVREAVRSRAPVQTVTVLPDEGRSLVLEKGQVVRVIQKEGPQAAEVALWNRHNPEEHFGAGRTMAIDALYLARYRQVWSEIPWHRPMMTCTDDTVATDSQEVVSHHHFLGTHCSPEMLEMRSATPMLRGCRINLLRAILPHGLSEEDLKDNLKLHQKIYLDHVTGRFYGMPSDAKSGDYVEMYAEIDLLLAISTCPFGDGSREVTDPTNVLRPLDVEVYDTGIEPISYPTWTDWRKNWSGRWVPIEHNDKD